jgi:hypothetical protein
MKVNYKMKKAFFINGGAGRVLCAIPALEWYKQNVDEDVIIVAEAWHELYMASPIIRDNVYPMGHKDLFTDKLKDREIVSPEPYRLNAYFNQKCNLIQAFDILVNDLKEVPETKAFNLEINKVDQVYGYNLIAQCKEQLKKEKVIVFQPFGSGVTKEGNFIFDSSGRSLELKNVYEIAEALTEHYALIMMTNVDIPPPPKQIGIVIPSNVNLLQWMGIINAADYFIGCDSMGQHYAHALKKPATVIIGSTCPENISYPDNKNFTIIDNGKNKRKYIPMRITHDFTGERNNEDLMILSDDTLKTVIKSVTDKLGKTKKTNEVELGHVHTPDCKHNVVAAPPFAKKIK